MTPIPSAELSSYMDQLLDAVCVVDKQGHYLYVSPSFERIFGYSPNEVLGRPMIELVHPDDRTKTLETAARISAGQPAFNFENRYLRKDGNIVHILWSARWSNDEKCRIAVARDITERKNAEQLQQAIFHISAATQQVADLKFFYQEILQTLAKLIPAENMLVALTGTAQLQMEFVGPETNLAQDKSDQLRSWCQTIIDSGQNLKLSGEFPPKRQLNVIGVPLRQNKETLGAICIFQRTPNLPYSDTDLELLQFASTQIASAIGRHQLMARLQYLALYDQLTGLPKRELFYDRIYSALHRAERDRTRVGVIYLDLNRFKEVNDTHGHSYGDLLLEQVARRLESSLRKGDTVARFGGDEFVVLLEQVQTPDDTQGVADKIFNLLSQPFDLLGIRVEISPSIGQAHYPEDGANAQSLIHSADLAMYARKQRR